ncbi:DUF3995 domain-containing protein [Chryseobacterium wangxinyae]|uniref:DUF3995 domain-containing protein n=1 Tax=Chryseobacterium sp. CY350 TaxID=2997336 RepID=UPI00226EF9A4|nr:DUF3995 domain-containing protein [Chryseobacterium sp. CY350]MCY0976820.1 DUF3995 domain-containing protein [Chryseobacterium sp. CY350]WBZ96821.1 DUF3995 domain-containing protein [Chryseobacterium sp. CY350]
MNVPGYFLITIFLSIALLHIYWAIGGSWGKNLAIPTTEKGIALFQPSALSCALIGALFILFSLSIAFRGRFSSFIFWVMVFIFFLRAIGDFRYVGFFKKIKKTPFAERDTHFYSPLCLLISLLILLQLKLFK